MKGFYDKMLVDKANSIGKKYGAKVEQKTITDGKYTLKQIDGDWAVFKDGKLINEFGSQKEAAEKYFKEKSGGQPIHYLPLTPELKRKAMEEGFPLFSSTPVLSPVTYQPEFDKPKYKLKPVQGNPFQ